MSHLPAQAPALVLTRRPILPQEILLGDQQVLLKSRQPPRARQSHSPAAQQASMAALPPMVEGAVKLTATAIRTHARLRLPRLWSPTELPLSFLPQTCQILWEALHVLTDGLCVDKMPAP